MVLLVERKRKKVCLTVFWQGLRGKREEHMQEKKVYLDHNATTPLHPEVKKAMQDAFEMFGNPSSLHSFGRKARSFVEESREVVASFINASAEEIIFVGSGSEGNNTVLSQIET